MSLTHIAILIPARNEEDLLPRCLASVLRACARLPRGVTYDIVVAVDASTDRTRDLADQMLCGHGIAISIDVGCVGWARIHAAQTALLRFHGPVDQCWIANTDADCVVPEDWLVKQIALADSGFNAVAGIVDVDSYAEHLPGVEYLFQTTYLIHPDGTHPHVHGANMGIRADAYLKAGGWGGLTTAEDHDLWGRLLHAGIRRASVARLTVTTSGRRIGRAPHGFAGALAAHNESCQPQVEVS
jgi:glycosyltransferase involved in cell wall biosynthesis